MNAPTADELEYHIMDLKDGFLKYRAEVEAGKAPKNLTVAFAAGARAALEILSDPFTCPHCSEKMQQISRQLGALGNNGTPPTKSEAK